MKLNICCGLRIMQGYTNIDVVANPVGHAQPDIMTKAHKLPIESDTVDEIICIHGWEHFYYWECEKVLSEWKRVLRQGGKLILELPDLLKCCQNLIDELPGKIHPDQMSMWGIYGDPREVNPLMMHRWGWTPKTLNKYLRDRGFFDVRELETEFHPVGRKQRDMRIEALRGV